MSDLVREVLEFWFGAQGDPGRNLPRKAWFEKNAGFDEEIRRRFGATVEEAGSGRLDGLTDFADGALAVTILLDQFPRNLFRGQARAFADDAKALGTATRAIEKGFDRVLSPVERVFLYLPFEHSESLEDQVRGVALFQSVPAVPWRAEQLDYAVRHRDIIARFGRFPHRNAALGRASTAEELAFLQQPGSSF